MRFFVLAFALFGASQAASVVRQVGQTITDPGLVDGQSFDHVIIGGGLAGSVLASRLSEDNGVRVLLIEAGGDTRDDDLIKTFGNYGKAFGDDRYDWDFKTTPQDIVGGKQVEMHQGRGLGGSTSINGGAFTLPPASQIDAWSTLGNAGWTFDVLLPFFDKFQNYIAPSDPIKALGVTANMTAHGPSGPVTIGFSDQMFTGPQEKTFIEGQRQALSAPQVVDLGTGMSGGAGFIPQTTLPNSGQARSRVSAATAYLTEAVQKRSNLSILLNTRATKLLYSSQTAVTASGVQLQARRDGPLFSVKAKKVIVAAGAIRTPVFLEHSGIGDKAILEKLGIASKVDLPGVGKNLCEQQKNDIAATPGQPLGAGLSSPSSAISMNTIGQLMNNATDMQAYIESNIEKWAKDAVDNGASASLQGLLAQYRVTIDGIFHRQWPVAETFFVTVPDSLIQQVWALLSFSRGHVHASSTSTWDDCLVDPRYWSASIDMELQVGASRGARKVFQSSAFKSILDGEETKPGYDPSQGGIPQSSDADTTYGPYDGWQRYILDNFVSVWHPIGTAAMLPQEMGGVVDAKFKVYSTENVYVVDSSIMPMQQSTHLSSVLYAIAEKAAIDLK